MLNRKLSRGVSKIQVGAMMAMAVLGVTSLARHVQAATVNVADSNNALTDPNAFVGAVYPGYGADTVAFGSNLSGTTNSSFVWSLGAASSDNSWAGIQVLNPGGAITINQGGSNQLLLGTAGIDMSAATQNLTLNVSLGLGGNQTWNVAAGRSLVVGGTVNGSVLVTVAGAGTTTISGGLTGGASLTLAGVGTLVMSSQSTYTGATTIGGTQAGAGGTLLIDFSGASAPTTNIASAGSQLRIGAASLVINGNALQPVSQAIGGMQWLQGLTTITTPNVGAGLTVNFGAITTSSQNNGAMVRFDANTTNSTLIASSVPIRTGGPLGTFIANNNGGMMATFGLYNWAAVNASGVIVPAGSPGTTGYTPVGPGVFNGSTGLIDITGGGDAVFSSNADYTAVRFNTNSSSQNVTGINNGRFGGFLMTPNVGANNVTVAGTIMRSLNQNNNNAQVNFWQNDTQGTLTVAVQMAGSGIGYVYTKAGLGLVIFSTGDKKAGGGIDIYEGELRVDGNNQLGTGTDGSPINIWGGTLGIGGSSSSVTSVSVFNSYNAIQHPIVIGGMGGGINLAGAGSTFTVSGSSNNAISGSGLLTITGTGTLNLANTNGTWTGGTSISGAVVNVTATTGTPLGTGPVNVAGGTLSISGNFTGSNAISVSSGGVITAAPTGTLTSAFTVGSGGTYLLSTGTVSSAITLVSGAKVTGAGNVTTALTLPSGAAIEPGTRTTVGSIGFQNLALQSGSILNLNLDPLHPQGGDLINVLPGGTLNLGSGVVVNMFYSSDGSAFNSNGSYQLFSGVNVLSPANYTGSTTSGVLTNFTTGNFGWVGPASATFQILADATNSSFSDVWAIISGGRSVSAWKGPGVDNNWQNAANWTAGVPGGLAGDIANLTGSSAISTINLNANVHLGQLGLDAGTNSGYTVAAGSGGHLFMDNGSAGAALAIGSGANSITALVDLNSPTTVNLNNSAGSLWISNVVNATSAANTLTIYGVGGSKLILTATNTIASVGTIAANGTLQLGNNGATGTWGTNGTINDQGTLVVMRTGPVNFSTLAGRITGAGTLTNAGATGQLIWDNTVAASSGGFTGVVNAAAGTVTVGAGSVWNGNGVAVGVTGKFDLGGNNLTLSSISSVGTIDNVSATPATLTLTGVGGTLGGVLQNSGGGSLTLVKNGTGTLLLNGTGSYTGNTLLNAGNIEVATSSALPANSTIYIATSSSGIILDNGVTLASNLDNAGLLADTWASVQPGSSATIAGNITFHSGTYTWFTGTASTLTLTGAMTSPGTYIQSGNFVWSGPNASWITNIGSFASFNIGRDNTTPTNVTLLNGASWSASTANLLTAGTGLLLSGNSATPVTLTVDHSTIFLGVRTVNLNASTATNSLNLKGGTIQTSGFIKTGTGAGSLNVDGGVILVGNNNATFFTGGNFNIGTGGAFIDTTTLNSYSIGIGVPINTGTTGSDGGLTLLGTGSVTLNGVGSTYKGPTTVATGTLLAGADNVFSPNSPLFVYGAGTVNGMTFSAIVGGLNDTQSLGVLGSVINFGTLTANVGAGQAYTYGGTLTVNTFAMSGAGTQILSGGTNQTWTNTNLGGGLLILSGTPVVTSGNLTVTGTGDGAIRTDLGAGISSGFTAASISPRGIGATTNFIVNGGTNGVNNGFHILTGSGFIDQGTFFNGQDYAFIDAGTISGFVRAPNYGTDAGFDTPNALTSGTHEEVTLADTVGSISFNTLKISGTGSLSATALTLNNAGILKSGGGIGSISGGTIQSAFYGSTAASEFVIRVDATGDVLNISSQILDNGGTGLTKSGLGVLKLSGANTFSGKLNILNGTVTLANTQAAQFSTIVLPSTGYLAFSGISAATITGLVNTAINYSDIALQNEVPSAVALTINLNGTGETLYNHFTGSGSLIKDGTGSLTLNAPSSFTGGVVLLNGTLSANGATLATGDSVSSLGTGPLTLSGGLFRVSTSGSHSVVLTNAIVANGNANFNLSGGNDVTFSGAFSGSGTVTRQGGSGVLYLTATDNSAFHGTFINGDGSNTISNVAFATLGALGATDSTWILNSANSMIINASASALIGFNLSSTVSGSTLAVRNANTASAISTTLNLGANNGNSTFLGNITVADTGTNGSTMTLVKQGTGLLALGGTASNYNAVTIQGGTLSVSSLDNGSLATTNALGLGGTVNMFTNTTLQYTGTGNTSIKTFNLAGNAALDASGATTGGAVSFTNVASISYSTTNAPIAITLTGSNVAQNTLAAQIVNNGTAGSGGVVSLVKNGAGNWALTGTANTYTGGTTVTAGGLMIANATGEALGTGLVSVSGTGKLFGTGYTTAPVTIGSGGILDGGTVNTGDIGTLNFGGLVTVLPNATLNFDMAFPGQPNDIVNFFGAGSLTLPGAANSVVVNLFNQGATTSYYYNGTYNLVTNAGLIAASATQALYMPHVNIAGGATFSLSYVGSNIMVTISGAWTNGIWNNNASTGTWSTSGDWTGGVPNGSGHLATFGSNILVPSTVTLTGGVTEKLTNLTFNNTNSYTIAPTTTESLTFMAGSSNGGIITVTAGKHTIKAPIVLDAALAVLTVNAASGTGLTVGNITGGGSLALTGAGSLVLTGAANQTGGTSIAAASTLVVGNGSTGTLSTAGPINNGGVLAFNHTDNYSFDVGNLVQTTQGTITQSGTGTLVLSATTGGYQYYYFGNLTSNYSGSQIYGSTIVNAGTLQFGTDFITNGTSSGNMNVAAKGTVDLNGHAESVRDFVNAGTITTTSGTGSLFLSSTTANNTNSGMITGHVNLIKDGTGTLTFASGGTVNNDSLVLLAGQVIYTSTTASQLTNNIIDANTNSTAALIVSGASISSNLSITGYTTAPYGIYSPANVEFVSTPNLATGTFAGNVTAVTNDTNGNSSYTINQMRLGNQSTSGTLTFTGNMTVPATTTVGMISRGNVVLAGNGVINSLAPDNYAGAANTFTIGGWGDTTGASVNFSMIGTSQLLTAAPDSGNYPTGGIYDTQSIGLRLGTNATAGTFNMTIGGNSFVRVGANGASAFDLNPNYNNNMNSTLTLTGGSIELSRFMVSGVNNYGYNAYYYTPQANVIFNGGTVMAGLASNDLTPGAGGMYNMLLSVGTGGLTLDLNGKQGVAWTKPLASNSPGGTTAAAFTDGGLTYVSRVSPATITLSTVQLYAGKTTIGTGATVIVGSSNQLGNPAVAAPLNFSGGVMKLANSFVLGSTDNGSTNLTHRFSFNDVTNGTNYVLDSVTSNVYNSPVNSNATQSGNGVLSMTGGNNSYTSSILYVPDIGGTATPYTTSGVTFAVWYTPGVQTSNATLFSVGPNSNVGPQSNAGSTASSFLQVTQAVGSATGNVRVSFDGGGGTLTMTATQPATGSQHLEVITIDNSDMAIYIDGVLANRVPLTTLGGGTFLQDLQNGSGIMLGGSPFSADPAFNGSFNEFRVYNSVLNPSFIASMTASAPDTLSGMVAMNRDITVAAAGGSLDLAGYELDVAGNITGAATGALTIANSAFGGSLVLTGSSSANLVIPTGSKVFVGTGGNTGALTGGNITNGDNITFNNAGASTLGALITGGTVTFIGSGTTTVTAAALPKVNLTTGALAFAVPTTVNGLFTVAAGSKLGFTIGTGSVTLTGGFSNSPAGAVTVLPTLGIGFDLGSFTVITGAGGSLSSVFPTAPAPSNGFLYTLDSTTNTGSLAIIVSSAWFNQLYWRSAAADTNFANNVNWSGSTALDVSNASGSPLGPTSVIFNNTNSATASLAAAGIIHDLNFSGSGVATVSGTAAGNLQILGTNAITVAANTGAVAVNPLGGLYFSNNTTITNNGTSGLSIGTIAGQSLTLAGSGVTTLSSANSFATGVAITGTVKVGNAAALGTTPVSLTGILDLGSTALAVGTITGAGTVTSSNAAASSLSTNIVGAISTFAGHIFNGAGTVGLTQAGSGTLVLTGTSSFSGPTTVAGQIKQGAANVFSPNSTLTIAANASADLAGFNTTVGNLSGPAGAFVTDSVGSINVLTVAPASGNAATFSGNLLSGSGTVSLVKSGAGSLTMAGTANSYAGTTLNGGVLSYKNATTLDGTITLQSGTLTSSVGASSNLANPIFVGTGYSAAIAADSSATGLLSTLSGNISGGGTLSLLATIKSNFYLPTGLPNFNGTLNVDTSFYNLYLGAAAANQIEDLSNTSIVMTGASNGLAFQPGGSGTVSIGALSGSGQVYAGQNSAAVSIFQIGNLNANTTFAGTFRDNVTTTGGVLALTKVGTGVLTLTGNSTGTGAITISQGTLQIGGGSTTGSIGSGAVTDNGTLAYNLSNTATLSNTITGTGVLTQAGTGLLNINGTNSYQGGTNFNAGTVSLGSTQPLGTVGSLAFNGGVLQFTATNTTDYSGRFSALANQQYKLDTNGQNVTFATGLASSGGSVTKLGAGNLNLTGAANYSGPTTIAAGVLNFSGGVAHSIGKVTGVGTLQVDTGTTLLSDGVNLLNGTWTINGTQAIRSSANSGAYGSYAAGNGSLTLSGTSEVSTLNFGASGHLNLMNNALIVEATPATKATLLAQISLDISSGAITSSTAASNPAYALVLADNADLSASYFGGIQVDANSIIITQALIGDANLDGAVTPADLLIWANNFNKSPSYSVAAGDLNSDGSVTPADLLLWANNFNNSISGNGVPSLASGGSLGTGGGLSGGGLTAPGGGAATPEPASLAVLALGAVGLLTRRRRRM